MGHKLKNIHIYKNELGLIQTYVYNSNGNGLTEQSKLSSQQRYIEKPL
jgi:hypothetical protein